MKFFKKIISFLSSMKLALISISLIILFCIPATMIPQAQGEAFYLERYNRTLGNFLLKVGYDHYFTSILFFIFILIFALNLFTCTIKRFVKQVRAKKKRFGPDIIHLGLLILILGALVSIKTRQEGMIYLKEGDSICLPSHRYLTLESFVFDRYPDGRPECWTSEVRVTEDLRTSKGELYKIKVNRPLRIDKLVIYQSSYKVDPRRVGAYQAGLLISLDPGKKYILLSLIFLFLGFLVTFIQKREVLK